MGDAADDMWDGAFLRIFDDEPGEGEFYLGVVTRETEKAVLFHKDGMTEGEWIPTSQIIRRSSEGIEITYWLADKKGWAQTDKEIEL